MKKIEIKIRGNTSIKFRSREEYIRFITRVIPPAYQLNGVLKCMK